MSIRWEKNSAKLLVSHHLIHIQIRIKSREKNMKMKKRDKNQQRDKYVHNRVRWSYNICWQSAKANIFVFYSSNNAFRIYKFSSLFFSFFASRWRRKLFSHYFVRHIFKCVNIFFLLFYLSLFVINTSVIPWHFPFIRYVFLFIRNSIFSFGFSVAHFLAI